MDKDGSLPLHSFNLICKNPPLHNQSEPRGVSEKCQSFSCILLAAPLPHTACTGQCLPCTGAVPALTWSDMFVFIATC